MRIALILAGLLLMAAPVAAQPVAQPPASPMLSVKELMRHVVNPAAEAFWKSGGTVSTEEGEQNRAPVTDAAWVETTNQAAILLEAGHLLQMPGRSREGPEWTRFAGQLTQAGVLGMAAARAKSEDDVFAAGGEAYAACAGCHRRYITRTQPRLP